MTTSSDSASAALGYLNQHARVRPHPVFDDAALHDLLRACASYAAQARTLNGLADTVTMDVRVPYDPPMLDLWEQAEPLLAAEFIGLDWSDWQVWTLDRALIGDDFDPAPFVQPVKGEYRVTINRAILALCRRTPRGMSTQVVEPERVRRICAALLAAAELAERRQAQALEGGVRP